MSTERRGGSAGDEYARLRAGIVDGRFQPNERLIELELARELGIGRAAVRTALLRLEQEGLVEREPNRGAKVRRVSEQEAVEIMEARAALEGLAVRHAAAVVTQEEIADLHLILEEMEARVRGGDLLGASDMNGQLHRRLIEIADHRTVSKLLNMLNSQTVRFQYRTVLAPGRPARSLEEHTAIVEAVEARDPDAAEEAMRNHLRHVTDTIGQTAERP